MSRDDLIQRLRKPLDGGDYSILTEAATEIERLRKGIQDYLDGNYPNPRHHRPGKCQHGVFYWEQCETCNDAYLSALLQPIPATT